MTARTQTRLWIAQRVTAVILALCVFVHLATLIYAVRGGLSAAEILDRTRGSAAWLGFYLLFVVAAAIHAPIGLRTVLCEMTAWRGRSLDVMAALFGLLLAALGLRAALAVFGWGAVFA